MSLESEIEKAVQKAMQPFYVIIEQNREMKEQLDHLEKALDKPLSIAECCEMLHCSRGTFWRYRDRLTQAGGTGKKPLFYRSEVLKLWTNPMQVASRSASRKA